MQNQSTRATWTSRLLVGAVAICALVGSASSAHAAPLASELTGATVQLGVVADGAGTVTASGQAPCVGSDDAPRDHTATECPYTYAPGQLVTLTAAPNAAGVSFVGWSDERCPGTGACTLPMDADLQSITALFSPQRLLVQTSPDGAEGVSTDAGPCQKLVANNDTYLDCGRFPIFSDVTLRADPPNDTAATWFDSQCHGTTQDPVKQPSCTVSVYNLTWAHVSFDGQTPNGTPPQVSVRFRVLKRGNGSGTVRSGSLDCGNGCAIQEDFGTRENLQAKPDSGSTFGGWQGACGPAPTCSLAVGPVTAVVAAFNALPSPSPGSSPGSQPSRATPRFTARLRRFVVSGHGRKRRILMRVQVNARAIVGARLATRRGHRVTSKRWRVGAGTPLLRLKVPARTRRGTYRLAVSLSDGRGHVVRVTRTVRMPR